VTFKFGSIPGATSYRLEMRHALPPAALLRDLSEAYFNSTADEVNATEGEAGIAEALRRRDNQSAPTWTPSLEAFADPARNELTRVVWSDPVLADFHVLWYRRVGDPEGSIRCITSDEEHASSGRPVSEMQYRVDDCVPSGSSEHANSTGPVLPPCSPPPACSRFNRSASFAFTTAALYHPRKPLSAPWSGISAVCSAVELPSFKLMLFVTRCQGDPENLDCDLEDPSQAVLIQVDCSDRLVTHALPLEDSAVALAASSCVLNSAISPYALYCNDSSVQPSGSWSAWRCVPERGAEIFEPTRDELVDGTSCLKLAEPQGALTGLSPCFHKDRFILRVVACMTDDCTQVVVGDEVFEVPFEHPSGMRAARCLKQPPRAGVTAGIAAASIIGGSVILVLGSSVGASVSGATASSVASSSAMAASGMGLVPMVGAVQFMGLTSDMCQVQANEKWQTYAAIMRSLNGFNLRIPVPAFLTDWSPFFGKLSLCGLSPVDLTAQARADIGDLFSGNMFFGFILLAAVIVAHLLLLQPTPSAWRKFVQKRAPFVRLELYVLLMAVQGRCTTMN